MFQLKVPTRQINIVIKIIQNVLTKWKEYNQSAEKDEFDLLKIGHLYNGNICLDLGSKWGSNIFYPRSDLKK